MVCKNGTGVSTYCKLELQLCHFGRNKKTHDPNPIESWVVSHIDKEGSVAVMFGGTVGEKAYFANIF